MTGAGAQIGHLKVRLDWSDAAGEPVRAIRLTEGFRRDGTLDKQVSH